MKNIIFSLATVAGIAALSSCTTVKEQAPDTHTSSTTTESSSVQQPVPATTETQTVRSY
jgi:outer membrane protein assembly factor BamE (lipoprotein component of BamABCDE complex)